MSTTESGSGTNVHGSLIIAIFLFFPPFLTLFFSSYFLFLLEDDSKTEVP